MFDTGAPLRPLVVNTALVASGESACERHCSRRHHSDIRLVEMISLRDDRAVTRAYNEKLSSALCTLNWLVRSDSFCDGSEAVATSWRLCWDMVRFELNV